MRIIEKLSKQIRAEIKDAEKYIECAAKHKMEDKELAELYYTLATEEIAHSERLHKAVLREIDRYKATGKEVPTTMQAVWNYQHEEIVEHATEVKMMIELYRR